MDVKLLVCQTPTIMDCDFEPTYDELELATFIAHALATQLNEETGGISDVNVTPGVMDLRDLTKYMEEYLNDLAAAGDWMDFLDKVAELSDINDHGTHLADSMAVNSTSQDASYVNVQDFVNWFECSRTDHIVCETTYQEKTVSHQ